MLKAVTEAIQKVQVGTDKTAAELALVRLTEELAEQKAALMAIEAQNTGSLPGIIALVAWAASTVIMMSMAGSLPASWSEAGTALKFAGFIGGIIIGIYVLHKLTEAESRESEPKLKPVRLRVEQLQLRIQEARRIADS